MYGWIWSNGGMILTGENWSTGRKTLYSVGGRWMDEYGSMVEWFWQGKNGVLGEKYYTAWVVDGWMIMEQCWNDTDRGKLMYWEKNIIQCGWETDEWIWSNGGMILTGEKWITERKKLYSVSGRWMVEYGAMVEWYWQGKSDVLGKKTLYSVGGRRTNEYGAMVEWYWQGKTEVVGEKHFTAWVVNGWMSMVQWWNDTDRGKLKYWEKNIIQRGWKMDEWVRSNSVMTLTGENWSTGRKTL